MDKWCEVASQPGAVQLDGCPVYTTRLLRRVRGRGSVQRGEADAANSVDQHGHRLTRRVGILVLHAALFSERNTLLITGAGSYTINHATDDDVPAAAGLIRSLEFTPLLSLSLSLWLSVGLRCVNHRLTHLPSAHLMHLSHLSIKLLTAPPRTTVVVCRISGILSKS